MKLHVLVVLVCALLAVSACVVEPYGDRGGRGDYFRGDEGQHDYGRRVWRP